MTLKNLRIVNKIKQVEVAKELNLSRIAIANYEKGSRTPSIEMLPKLAEILNCSIEELVLAIIETKKQSV